MEKLNRKVKIFGHPWHLAHQYELLKFPFAEWDWLVQYRRPYSEQARGDFAQNWVTHYEKGKYDLAVLHLDQQCIEDDIMARGKGRLYKELNELIDDVPKIVIMHGTTYYPEKFSKEEVISKVKRLVGDNVMVTNSKQAAKDFGFGTPIWHGMDANEWWDLPKEPRAVTMVSPAGLDKYYDRNFLDAIREELWERDIRHCHITVDWRSKNWDEYRDFIGRSLIFIAPFYDSPMPRSRTEAMLSGSCVLTTPHQDAGTYVEDSKNGFIIPRNPKYVAELTQKLIEDYQLAVDIGQEGKRTARELFNNVRYQNEWKQLIEKTIGKEIVL